MKYGTPLKRFIDIGVPSPSVRWLRHPDQLTALRALYERAFADARLLTAGRIHLYYAGPTAAAVEFGRAYNPRMNPPLELYEFALSSRPRYEAVLLLNQPRA